MTVLLGSTFDIIAILPAAGNGSRMRAAIPKQYLTIGKKTLLEHTVNTLLHQPRIQEVIIAISATDCWYHQLPIITNPKIRTVIGGISRSNSVMAALNQMHTSSWILIHDAVRPCLHQKDLYRLLAITAHTNVGGLLALPVHDTIKRAYSGTTIIAHTIERTDLWHALTPQLFPYELLKHCLKYVIKKGIEVTDEASALEYCGYMPLLVPGRSDNIKVTYPEDLALASSCIAQMSNTE